MNRSALRVVLAAAFVTALSTMSRPARAQLGTPGDVDKCSLSEAQKSGDDCLLCRAYYRNNQHCAHSLTDYGYSKSCRMRGASMWREVWCRKKDPSAKPLPPALLASLDDATVGESRGDASADDAAVAVTSPTPDSEAGAAPTAPEAGPLPDGASTVAPKGQSSGCGTCAIGEANADATFAAASGLAVFVAFGARRKRRTTPSRRARSAHS